MNDTPFGRGHDAWMNMAGGHARSAPLPSGSPTREYKGFDYDQAPMPIVPSYSMARPPPYAAGVPQMPSPLVVPQHAIWPSMLAAQSHQQSNHHQPILPAASIQTPVSAGTGYDVAPISAKNTKSRKKLTDDERRQMCLEAEQNPTMKQTQIGAKFNVERSTVSKILRQKDKYMNPPSPKEEVTTSEKKSKAKLPVFERTLTKWVINQQKKGLTVTDQDLRKQARVFSISRSDKAPLSSPGWLENFKQNNGLGRHHDSVNPGTTSPSETTTNASPASSSGDLVSPPMSASDDRHRGAVNDDQSEDYFDFESKNSYRHPLAPTQASVSEMEGSLSGSFMSPLSPDHLRDSDELPDLPLDDAFTARSSSRQRSQTFPHLTDLSGRARPIAAGQQPGIPVRSITSSLEPRPTAVDPRRTMKRHKSVPDIHDARTVRFSPVHPPPLLISADMSPFSDPASPGEDDNMKALRSIKKLLQSNPRVADADDYVAIGKLMGKLKLLSCNPQMSKAKKRTFTVISM